VKYTELDVSRNREAAEEMVELTHQMGVPVTVINGQPVIGFDPQRIKHLVESGNGEKPVRFGLKIADADKIAQQHGEVPVFGALIGEVAVGTPGERAGLQTGDIITRFNTSRISNAADLEKALVMVRPGNIVTIMFLRGSEDRKSEIVI
jgi:membrane-associated protease RseP (regulator of RpoE activity)